MSDNHLFFTPIACPLLAGASTIGYIIALSGTASIMHIAFIATISMVISCLVLGCGLVLLDYLSPKIPLVLERIAGMLLIMLAVQALLDGISLYLR